MTTLRSRRCCEAGAVPVRIWASSCCCAAPIDCTLRNACWNPRLVSICSISTPSRLAVSVTPLGAQVMLTVMPCSSWGGPDARRLPLIVPLPPAVAG